RAVMPASPHPALFVTRCELYGSLSICQLFYFSLTMLNRNAHLQTYRQIKNEMATLYEWI
ncbi:MAG: hypothetical protein ACYC43_12515, partial [Burkholderiales bacterium]